MINISSGNPSIKATSNTKSNIPDNSKPPMPSKKVAHKANSSVPSKKLDSTEISALEKMADQANENLRRLVENLILKQGNDYQVFKLKGIAEKYQGSISDIEKAELAISENGEFGIKAVSDRLVNFAKAISGGDKSKISQLKSAIDKGFAAAKDALGGYLPPICNETYKETMRKLDDWIQED